jgi:ribonuclease Z
MATIVTVTGTGVPHLEPGRAGPGVLVESGDVRLQFDAGRATSLRLCEAGVRMNELTALFVTHHHSDHLTGLVDLLFARWLENHGSFAPLPVVAPAGPSTDFLERIMVPWEADLAIRMEHVGRDDRPDPAIVAFDPVAAVDGPAEVWRDDAADVTVLARCVHHEPVTPAVAYRIETPDGVVVISGDTRVCDEVADLAADADVLVHEAFRTDALRGFFEIAPHLETIAAYHADTVELGEMAERIAVPRVVLTHMIPAPDGDRTLKQDFVDDLRRGGYGGEVIVADDLTSVTVRRSATP